MIRMGSFLDTAKISRRVRATNYLSVAQIFLCDNFLTRSPLRFEHIKPRLLGHWGTCPGINLAYACLKEFYQKDRNFTFVLGPGHGFPALQANLFIDGDLQKVDPKAIRNEEGIAYICKNFSWPGGFPSHASPVTPHVICEGGELGYALATAYGYCLGHPERTVAVLIGDGEFETATALASLNLNKILAGPANGKVLPILHLNGYKISGPTISGRKSQRELAEQIRGFGYTPFRVSTTGAHEDVVQDLAASFAVAFDGVNDAFKENRHPFIIMESDKGMTGPETLGAEKISGNFLSHQVPLKNARTDTTELQMLEDWLHSYKFDELFDMKKGFKL